MAINRDSSVPAGHFSGAGRVHGSEVNALGAIVRDDLVRKTKARLRARNLVDMTDSSSGVAGLVLVSTFATDLITLTPIQPNLKTGDGPFQLGTSGADLPSGLLVLTDYFVRSLDATGTTFNLHLTKSAALGVDAPVALADDGTGTHALLAIAEPVRAPEADVSGGVLGILDTSLDTSVDTFTAAYGVMMERVNEARALINAGSLDEGPGVIATSGTIAVLDVDVAVNNNDTDAVTYASWRTIEQELVDAEQTLVQAINEIRAAVGLGLVPATGDRLGNADEDLDLYDGDAATNASPTVDAAGAAGSVLNVPVDALLAVLQDNVALLADQIDDVTDAANVITTTIGPIAYVGASSLDVAGSKFVTSPVSGRIVGTRSLVTIVIGAGNSGLTLEIEGSPVTGAVHTFTATDPIGFIFEDAVSGVIAPGTANSNYVAKGQQIEIVNDGVTASGEALFWLDIDETQEDTGSLVTAFGDAPLDQRAGV